jgi:hypothetical protein
MSIAIRVYPLYITFCMETEKEMADFGFSQQCSGSFKSSRILRRVVTDVSGDHCASIFRV